MADDIDSDDAVAAPVVEKRLPGLYATSEAVQQEQRHALRAPLEQVEIDARIAGNALRGRLHGANRSLMRGAAGSSSMQRRVWWTPAQALASVAKPASTRPDASTVHQTRRVDRSESELGFVSWRLRRR